MKKLFFILSIAAIQASYAQDIHFSQLTETPLLLNPANTALSHDFMAIVNYKDQWKSVTANPFRTFNFATDVSFMKKKNGSHGGFGIDIFSDKAGDGQMGTTTGQVHLSGVIGVDDNNLISAGIYGGFGQRSLQYQNLYWDNQYINGNLDLTAPTGEMATFSNRSYADIGAGLAWFYGHGHATITSNDQLDFTLGGSVQHINQPIYTFYGATDQHLPMKYVLHGNADIGIKNYSLVLQPGLIFMMQGGHREINAGALIKYWLQEASHFTGRKKAQALVLGAYCRFGDAINLMTGVEMSTFRLGLSYDVNISDLTNASKSRGGIEISLRYTFEQSGDNKNKSFFN